jgi:hypothetical protein
MRLTLRTLLAYMEDRLPPANAREIGQKIAKSPFSTELMDRIREVLRKRRLANAGHSQSTIDANLVAEYLDDQLTPELVARIEREFLSSDIALAEIAASYQIVASLHETVAIEDRLRQRLYDLDPSGRMEVVHALGQSTSERQAVPAEETSAAEWQPLGSRVASSGRLPIYVVIAMAFVWLGVVSTDPALFTDASDQAQDAVAVVDINPGGDDVAGNDVPTGEDDSVLLADVSNDAEPAVPEIDVPDESTTPVTVEMSDTGTGSTQPANATTGQDSTVKPPAADSATEVVPADQDPLAAQHVAVRMLDSFQAVMVLGPDTGMWSIARPGGAGDLSPDERQLFDWSDTLSNKWLSIPGGFETTISIDDVGWAYRLLGPAISAVTLESETPGFSLVTGRAFIESTPIPGVEDDVPRSVYLGAGATMQQITLLTADTVVGVEVALIPPRPDSAALANNGVLGLAVIPVHADRRISLYVVAGRIQLHDANGDASAELQERQSVTWTSLPSGENTDVIIQDLAQPGLQPDWLFPQDPLPEIEALKSQVADKLASSSNLSVAAVEESADRNSQVAVLAAGYLAVTRSIGPLLSVLLQSNDESVRRAAIDGLSAACSQTRAGFEEVKRQLETHLPQTDADLMLALLYGVSEEQARQPAFCAELLGLLSHDKLILRELAFYRMETIIGDRYSYSADTDAGRRRDAVRRWQRHLDRNGGRLIP